MKTRSDVHLISICGCSILVEEEDGNEFVLPIEDYRTREQLHINIENALKEHYKDE